MPPKSAILMPSQYDVLIGVWNKDEPYFRFSDSQNAGGFLVRPWRVAPEDKTRAVHVLAGAGRSLVDVFPDAIAIASPAGRAQRTELRWVMLMTPVTIMLASFGVGLLLHGNFYPITWVFLLLAAWFLIMQIRSWKNWLCAPSDWPVIFNRENRTVSYPSASCSPRWKSFFGRADPQYRAAGWDEARVRSYRFEEIVDWRASRRYCRLMLLWGSEGNDPRLVSCTVAIGHDHVLNDAPLWMLWEHIRRYMEENGPPVADGETRTASMFGKQIAYPSSIIEAAGGAPRRPGSIDESP
ncbi:hypothetical protein [Achromobacter aloeverae]